MCAGIARRLGIDPLPVRVVALVLALAGGIGVPLYLIAWAALPADGESRAPSRSRRSAIEVALGVGLLAISAMLTLRGLGLWFSDAITWPLALVAGGVALVWRGRTSAAVAPLPATATPEPPPQSERVASVSRQGLGAALFVAAGLVFLQATGSLSAARDVILAALVVAIVGALIFAPWTLRMARSLTVERAERIRSQERAELAAHLHDSVLQTLALMQKRADDPREIAALARAQERELRAWLAGRAPSDGERRLAAALETAAADVEATYRVPVDVVAVGDADLDTRGEALVAAAREAMVNAAKFGAGSPVAVYAEADGGSLQVFVRDRGPGFDPGAVPADRRGLRESVVGRMARNGGRATVTAAPGAGTEVELVLESATGFARGRENVAERRSPSGGRRFVTVPRVVVVDDHALFRSGVRAELESHVEIVGDAASVAEAIDVIAAAEPDVVLLDVHLPDGTGGDVITAIAPEHPSIRFLALSVSDAAEDVIAVIRAGARGYVTKSISVDDLADAVLRVHDGDAVFSPRLAGFVLDAFAGAPPAPAPVTAAPEVDPDLEQLTAREREVLQHLARGYLYKEIAHRLGISTKTVEAHVSAVLRKLQLSNRHELSRWATTRRLVD